MREGNLANQSDGRRQQNSSKFTIFYKKVAFLKIYMQLFRRKLHFSGKKGPCGHAHTQTKVVDTKMNDNLHICSQQSVNKTATISQKVVFFTNEALRRRKKIPPLPIDVKKYAEFESDLRKIHL